MARNVVPSVPNLRLKLSPLRSEWIRARKWNGKALARVCLEGRKICCDDDDDESHFEKPRGGDHESIIRGEE